MPNNVSAPLKTGKKIESNSANDYFSNSNAIEMDEIETLSEQMIAALSVEAKSNNPFDLLNHYKINHSSSTRTHYFRSPLGSDKETALELLIAALKVGDDRHLDLVSLLLNDTPFYEESQQELSKLFEQNQKKTLPVKQDLCILSAMQDILRDVKELLEELSPPMVDRNKYYEQLILRLAVAKDDYIRGQFDINVGMYLHDENIKEQSWFFCLQPLKVYLPASIEEASQSYFAIPEDGNVSAFCEKIDQSIDDFDCARNTAQLLYEHRCSVVAEFENCLGNEKRVRREELVAKVLQIENNEFKAGIPYLYKDHLSNEKLNCLAGLVPFNAIDINNIDQSNISLIALQYNNCTIYRKLFSSYKDLAETSKINLKGLSAEHYDKALFWKDKAEKQQSSQLIMKKDSKGELLRKIEKDIHQYLQNWHKKNDRIYRASQDRSYLEKMMVSFISYCNTQNLFVKRQNEANTYLHLVQDAMKGIPAKFYKELEKCLRESNWGPLGGSQLHKMMNSYRNVIRAKKEYSNLVNPSSELYERLKILEEKMQSQELQFEQKMIQKDDTHKLLETDFKNQLIELSQDNMILSRCREIIWPIMLLTGLFKCILMRLRQARASQSRLCYFYC